MHAEGDALPPILVAHLLEPLDRLLVGLLASLPPAGWDAPTIVAGWRVRDIAAHLLDTQLRKLAICRDGAVVSVPRHDPARDLVGFVNRLNADGVRFFTGLAPAHLVELIRVVSSDCARYHASLDPMAPAVFGVSWAGDTTSPNWFDIARELTERWHHQQQIRLAVHRPGAMSAEFHHPVLDCFMRALPHWYQPLDADEGSLVEIAVEGDGGGSWFLLRADGTWRLVARHAGTPAARATIPADIAWRIFTKGIARDAAATRVALDGDRRLASHVLAQTAIVG